MGGNTEHKQSYFFCLEDLSCERASAIVILISLSISVWGTLGRQGAHLWDFGRFWDTQRFWQSSCNSSSCCTVRDQETEQQMHKLSMFWEVNSNMPCSCSRRLAEEKCFGVAVWICHPAHPEQRQMSLVGMTAAKTHRGTYTLLSEKSVGPITTFLSENNSVPVTQRRAEGRDGAWRSHSTCR